MAKLPQARISVLLALIALLSLPSFGWQGLPANRETPEELQARDPQVRDLLEAARVSADAGKFRAAFAKEKQALDMAEKNGYAGDIALVKATIAVADFSSGKLEEGWKLDREALQGAIESSNLVLQADILVTLSTQSQSEGNLEGSLSGLTDALHRAEASKNLYIKSRVLGELGRIEFFLGEQQEAQKSIDEALRIDTRNNYSLRSLHLVYRAYLTLSNKETAEKGIQELEAARSAALEDQNYLALAMAESALGTAYVGSGQIQKGTAILEAMSKGDVKNGDTAQQMPEAFRAVLELPFVRLAFLEARGNAYEAAKQPDRALEAWSELYTYSQKIGLISAEAEAAQHMANIYAAENDMPHAVSYASEAVRKWRTLHNDRQLAQSLLAESVFLVRNGQTEASAAVNEELAHVAAGLKDRPIEFLAYGLMGEAYQTSGKYPQSKDALERAQALIQPGPADSTIKNAQVIEVYIRLAVVYEKLGDEEKELAALEKALAIGLANKDQRLIGHLFPILRGKFDAIHVDKLIGSLYDSGKLLDALTYAELVYVFKGAPSAKENAQFWELMGNIPFRLAAEPGGASALEENLRLVGPILGFAKLSILLALAQHYAVTGDQPELGRKYAEEAASLVTGAKTFLDPLKERALCTLAMAYARTDAATLAIQEVHQCMELARSDHDLQSKTFANLANVFVHVLANDIGGAQESIQYLTENAPDNAVLHQELAEALGKNGRFREALVELEVALRIYQRHKDNTSVANTYMAMARMRDSENSAESKREELADLQAAIKLYRQTQDFAKEGAATWFLAQYYSKLNKKRKALEYLQRVLTLAQKDSQEDLIGNALSSLGLLYFGENDLKRAVEFHRKAVLAYQNAKDSTKEAFALLALGQDFEKTNHFEDALASYLKAQSAAVKSGSPLAQYSVHSRVGWLYRRQGQLGEAETAFRAAREIAESAGDNTNLAWSYLALAELHEVAGDWKDAAEETNEALRIFQRIGDREGESGADADLVSIYGDRTSTMKDFDLALKYYADAQKLRYSKGLELDLLEIYLQSGRYSEAVASSKQGILACQESKDIQCQANGLISLAEAERLKGDLSLAAADLRRAKSLASKVQDFYLQGRFLYGEANLERARANFKGAVSLYEQVIALIEKTKSLVDREQQLSLSEAYDFVYDELIDSLYSLSRQQVGQGKLTAAIEALRYTEENKARQFANAWGETFIGEMSRGLPVAVLAHEQQLSSRRDQLGVKLEAAISGHPSSTQSVEQIQKDLATAAEDLKDFVAGLRSTYPAYVALKYPDAVTLNNILLRRGETLAEFKMTDDGTFVWLVRNETGEGNSLLSFYKVPQKKKWFDQRVTALRDAFNGGKPEGYDPRISEQLFDALFPGVHAIEILNSDRIIWIPDGTLFLVPLEMLSPHATQGRYPLLSIPTKYYPSAGALRVARTGLHPTTWKEAFLGVGNPVTSQDDSRYGLVRVLSRSEPTGPQPGATSAGLSQDNQIARLKSRGFEFFGPLPWTETEVRDIAQLFSERHQGAEVLLGLDATKRDVLDTDLSRFRYIHFATHGVLPVDAGIKEPSLVLSYDGTTLDQRFLSMSTILKLKITADSVVLSACNTGSGNVSRAEGVMSLGRAFMAAGASSVTVSLWEVSDKSTARLMEEYYRNLLAGKRKDEALADARAGLFRKEKRYTNPFYWAPFILIGD